PLAVAPQVAQTLTDFFHSAGLDPASLIERFEATAAAELGQRPDVHFQHLVAPFRGPFPGGFPSMSRIAKMFKLVEMLLGTPEEPAVPSPLAAPRLARVLREFAGQAHRTGSLPLAQAVLQFLDRPGFRLGAAEEAVRVATDTLEEWLKHY